MVIGLRYPPDWRHGDHRKVVGFLGPNGAGKTNDLEDARRHHAPHLGGRPGAKRSVPQRPAPSFLFQGGNPILDVHIVLNHQGFLEVKQGAVRLRELVLIQVCQGQLDGKRRILA